MHLGSRLFSAFLVDAGASMIVASTTGPSFINSPHYVKPFVETNKNDRNTFRERSGDSGKSGAGDKSGMLMVFESSQVQMVSVSRIFILAP